MKTDEFLCCADELIEGQFSERRFQSEGEIRYLVVTRHRGVAKAWLNVCPHQGRPLNWAPDRFLSDDQGHLVCAAHGAVFECDQGRCISGPCKNANLRAVAIEESDGQVRILPDRTLSA